MVWIPAYVGMTIVGRHLTGHRSLTLGTTWQRHREYCRRTRRRAPACNQQSFHGRIRGRFRSCIAQQEEYLLVCQRYIEMNPVRAGLVEHPGDYHWSSYGCNGQGETSDLLNHHPVYLGLGRTGEERQAAYRELFRHELEPGIVDRIRQASNGNFALGNPRFTEEIAAMLGRRVIPGKAGRPCKKSAADGKNTEKKPR